MERNGKEWGYASCDENGNLIYTRYQDNGSVNRYKDNGDGGHGHEHWNNADDYNKGKEADQSRTESNDSKNPSVGEIQGNSGCFLTTACMQHYLTNFSDDCYELAVLRWFRDSYVSKEDKTHYYSIAPQIVKAIDSEPNKEMIYNYIYDNIVDFCVNEIENGNYIGAYGAYKENITRLEMTFIGPQLKLLKAGTKFN